jgi:hypothetical protein
VPEIYVIMAIPLKCVAVLFRMSSEGNTTLSAIKAYNGYHPCHRELWINPAANITFSVITLEDSNPQPRCWEVRSLTTQLSS